MDAMLQKELEGSPVYWFCVLETARERGDYRLAEQADQKLKEHGIQVRYGKGRRQTRRK